jgi:hypothetical protein
LRSSITPWARSVKAALKEDWPHPVPSSRGGTRASLRHRRQQVTLLNCWTNPLPDAGRSDWFGARGADPVGRGSRIISITSLSAVNEALTNCR